MLIRNLDALEGIWNGKGLVATELSYTTNLKQKYLLGERLGN